VSVQDASHAVVAGPYAVSVVAGQWSKTLPDGDALAPDGTYTVRVAQSDGAGNTGHDAKTFMLDTHAPAPSVDQPTDPGSDSTPTLIGSAGTQATDDSHSADDGTVSVKLYAGSDMSGTLVRTLGATPDNSGNWSIGDADWTSQSQTPLPDGTYTVQAAQSDGAGNAGKSTARTFKIDATAPDVALNAVTSPTNAAKPALTGTAGAHGADGSHAADAASVTVKVYAGSDTTGTLVRTLTASRDGSGNWSIAAADWNTQTQAALPDGTYTARAAQSDGAGNTGKSPTRTFKVDTVAPGVELAAVSTPTSAVRPALSGTAGTQTSDDTHSGDSATVTVKIYAGSDTTGTLVRTLTASRDGSGNWSIAAADWNTQTQAALGDGTYTARVVQSDDAGNTGNSTARTFKVDATAPAPTLTSPANGSSVATGTPTFAGTGGKQGATDNASSDSGTVTVKVYSGTTTFGTLVQTLSAPRDGTTGAYSVLAAPALANGTYTAQAEQTDGAGNTGLSTATTFTVNTLNYNFTGFFAPVTKYDPTNVVFNQVKAGAAVPVKFNLGGNKGLGIFEAGYPASQVIPCTGAVQVDGIEETVTAGQSSLSYDSTTGQYTYVWKTDKSWSTASAPCRQLVVKFMDGTYQRANFKFTK
jgi:hypothetical protein